jgi:tetratricopeptide (TPR) repeat protein
LAEARRRSREATFLDGELSATLNLANLYLFQRDFRLAHDYILLVVESFKALGGGSSEPSTKVIQPIYDVLISVARVYYYELEDFEEAASLSEKAIHLLPQGWDGYFYLGNAQLRLERYEAAAQTWKSAIALLPTHASSYFNYGIALSQIGRDEEALAALDEAIRLSPDDLRYQHFRGQVNQMLNRNEDAIADFTHTIRLCEQLPEREGASSSGRTRNEYLRNIPNRDASDIARIARIHSYQALGKIEEALADIDYLIQHGDDTAQFGGYGLKGHLYVKLDRYSDAIAAYSAAIQLSPDSVGFHLSRAAAYIALSQVDEAIQDLIFVADKQRQPENAIERFSQLLAQHPDHPQLLKWRGYAYREAWMPDKAVEDLTRAHTYLPNDADIYLWRGLSLITFGTRQEGTPRPGTIHSPTGAS